MLTGTQTNDRKLDFYIAISGEKTQFILKDVSLYETDTSFFSLIEPRHEKTCLCHMPTTKAQISLRICAV